MEKKNPVLGMLMMKKMVRGSIAALLAITGMVLVAGCGSAPAASQNNESSGSYMTSTVPQSTPAQQPSGSYMTTSVPQTAPQRDTSFSVPDSVRDAMRKPTAGMLVGIGTATIGRIPTQAINSASSRAYGSLAEQLQIVVKKMFDDHIASNEADLDAVDAFQETVLRTLTQARLLEASPVDLIFVGNTAWSIVEMPKVKAAEMISAAAKASRLNAPKASNADAQSRLAAALESTGVEMISNQLEGEAIPVVEKGNGQPQ